jgi:hypothetical protein
MVTIAVLCIAVALAEGMNVAVLLGTAVFLVIVYVLARLMIRSQRRS